MEESPYLNLSRNAALLVVSAVVLMVAVAPLNLLGGALPFDSVIIGTVAATAALLPYMRARGRDAIPTGVIGVVGAGFFALGAVSAAVNGFQLAHLFTLARYVMYGVFSCALASLALDSGARRTLLWVVAAGGALTFIPSTKQYAGGVVTAGMAGLSPAVSTRVTGTFHNANFYSEFLVIVLGIALALTLLSSGRPRFLAGVVLLGSATMLVLTYTRGSWIAVGVALVLVLPLIGRRFLVAFFGVSAAVMLVVPGALDRLTSVLSTDGSTGFRLSLWRIARVAIADNPLFGVGPGDFLEGFRSAVIARPDLFMGYFRYGAHNSFLTVATEIGILGGVLFLLYVVRLAFWSYGAALARRVDGAERIEAIALGAGTIAFVLTSFSSNSFQHPQAAFFFFVVVGLQFGLVTAARESFGSARVGNEAETCIRSATDRSPSSAWCWLRVAWSGSVIRSASNHIGQAGHEIVVDSGLSRLLFGRRA